MRVLLLLFGLVAMSLSGLTACGGGGGGGTAERDAVREAVFNALTAPSVPQALLHIDTAEWLQAIEDPAASSYRGASAAEKRAFDERLFAQMQTVGELSELGDGPAIRAAIAAGTVEILGQVNVANVRFQGPDAERPGTIAFVVKMRNGLDGRWRLVSIQADF